MGEAVLDVVNKKHINPSIKRVELDYKDMNYIIVNLVEHVIDVNGELWEYNIDDKENKSIEEMVWKYQDIDEFDYWPDKTKDHAPMSPMWRISWYDEFDTYYHKSGALSYPPEFMDLVNILKKLK